MKKYIRLVGALLFVGAGVASAADGVAVKEGTVIYRVDGAVTLETEGWTLKDEWLLAGPILPAEPNAFYRLTFTIRARERTMWSIFYYEAPDREMRIADNYGSHFGYGKQTLTRMVRTEDVVHFLRPVFQSTHGLEVWDLEIAKIGPAEALAIHEEIYAALPPFDDATIARIPTERLPRTFEAMRTGKSWHVLLLGDSIMNDTSHSSFPALLKKHYPALNWRVTYSIRGGTGCWHYREPEHFKAFVSDFKPDLVVIGGVSHQTDLEAVQSVVESIRRELPDAEILLLTGPGYFDRREINLENQERLAQHLYLGVPAPATLTAEREGYSAYYASLKAYAEREGLAFGDMEQAWTNYLIHSGLPYMYLHRGAIHSNEFGKALLARIFTAMFIPE